jgi:hypothetical protein
MSKTTDELKKREEALTNRGKLVTYNKSRTNFYYVEIEGNGEIFVLYDSEGNSMKSGKHKECLEERERLKKL